MAGLTPYFIDLSANMIRVSYLYAIFLVSIYLSLSLSPRLPVVPTGENFRLETLGKVCVWNGVVDYVCTGHRHPPQPVRPIPVQVPRLRLFCGLRLRRRPHYGTLWPKCVSHTSLSFPACGGTEFLCCCCAPRVGSILCDPFPSLSFLTFRGGSKYASNHQNKTQARNLRIIAENHSRKPDTYAQNHKNVAENMFPRFTAPNSGPIFLVGWGHGTP